VNDERPGVARLYAGIFATLGWVALVAQLYLVLRSARAAGTSPVGATITYASYFTIIANTLMAVVLTTGAVDSASPDGAMFTDPRLVTAVVVYMTIVGLVYSLLLRGLVELAGAPLVLDRILHDIMPVVAVVYWIAFVPKGRLRWRDAVIWLALPLGYIGWIVLRGVATGLYPYPFVDVGAIGYPRALVNTVGLTVAFWVVGLCYVAADRAIARRWG
jgi:hypothetical protein